MLKCSPDWLLNFFTGGFGDLLESYWDDFLEPWGISLRPLFKNEFEFCSTKPFLLLGEFFRCPGRTSGWLPITDVTIVGNGSGCLVVVRCVVVDLVGGGPHIKSEVKIKIVTKVRNVFHRYHVYCWKYIFVKQKMVWALTDTKCYS